MAAQRLDTFAGIVLVLVHGLLLWVLVPLGFVVWLVTAPWMIRYSVSLGRFLGWLDLNLLALLQRSILRPLILDPVGTWAPLREMPHVTHRINFAIDPL